MDIEPRIWVLIAGLALGLVAGFAARTAEFCTFGAIADAVVVRNQRRLRAWALALAVALIGSQALHHVGVVDLGGSIYLSAPFNGALVPVGGLLFGLGMALVGTCGFGMLIRFGGGDLRALVDMACLGFFAYLTLSGPIAYVRVYAAEATDLAASGLAAPGLIELAGHLVDRPAADLRPALVALIGSALLAYSLKDRSLRAQPNEIASALLIGAVIPLGWLATGYLGHDPFEPVPLASLTFVRPIGEGFLYMMLMSGMSPTFGIATVAGVLLGAHLAARAKDQWRIEGFDGDREMKRHLAGAALMGVGGVLALGCTIGQGMSAMSTLALSAPLTMVAIFFGAVIGLRYLEEGSIKETLRVLAGRSSS
ncbi:MAG: YeeE/YedE family protein [Alphaproteobacteria bacterium]|nr:YeeE/YedE family protein [Alphaproteobacteria bacterium]